MTTVHRHHHRGVMTIMAAAMATMAAIRIVLPETITRIAASSDMTSRASHPTIQEDRLHKAMSFAELLLAIATQITGSRTISPSNRTQDLLRHDFLRHTSNPYRHVPIEGRATLRGMLVRIATVTGPLVAGMVDLRKVGASAHDQHTLAICSLEPHVRQHLSSLLA